MAGQYGVENLKQLLDLGFGIGQIARGALADGKIDFNDLALLMPLFPLLGPAISNVDQVPKEFMDLDKDDQDKLIMHGKAKLAGLPDDEIKEIVRHGLRMGLHLGGMLSILLKKAPPAPKP